MYTFVLTQRGGDTNSYQAHSIHRVRTSATFLLRRQHPRPCDCTSSGCEAAHGPPTATITSVRRVVRIQVADENGDLTLLHCLKERVYLYTLFPDPYTAR